MLDRQSTMHFRIVLVLSILLHVLLGWWFDISDLFGDAQKSTTVQVTLQQPSDQPKPKPKPPEPSQKPPPPPPPPEPKPEEKKPEEKKPEEKKPEDEMHLPMNNADDFASTNNTDKSKNRITPGEKPDVKKTEKEPEKAKQTVDDEKPKPSDKKKTDKTTDAAKEPLDSPKADSKKKKVENPKKPQKAGEVVSTTGKSSSISPKKTDPKSKRKQVANRGSLSTEANLARPKPRGVEKPNDKKEKLGNAKMPGESADDPEIDAPYSEIAAKRLRMVNRYLAEMETQIKSLWVKPPPSNRRNVGIIRFSLNEDGYLDDAEIYHRSGDPALDVSALDAIRRVNRYAVPESKAVTRRYYRNLRFQYSSHDVGGKDIPGHASKPKYRGH